MKCEIMIDAEREEKVVIFAHQKTELVEQIERLVMEQESVLTSFLGDSAVLPCQCLDSLCADGAGHFYRYFCGSLSDHLVQRISDFAVGQQKAQRLSPLKSNLHFDTLNKKWDVNFYIPFLCAIFSWSVPRGVF